MNDTKRTSRDTRTTITNSRVGVVRFRNRRGSRHIQILRVENKQMSEELEQLKKEYHSWDHSKAGDRYIERLWSVGDKLQVQVDELNRELHIADKQLEALTEENKQLRERYEFLNDIHKKLLSVDHEKYEKLEAIKEICIKEAGRGNLAYYEEIFDYVSDKPLKEVLGE